MKIHCCPTCKKPYNFKILLKGSISKEEEMANNMKKYVEFKSNIACSICLEDYVSESNLPTSLPSCTHVFHSVCIRDLLRECEEECPICRSAFDESELILRNDLFT